MISQLACVSSTEPGTSRRDVRPSHEVCSGSAVPATACVSSSSQGPARARMRVCVCVAASRIAITAALWPGDTTVSHGLFPAEQKIICWFLTAVHQARGSKASKACSARQTDTVSSIIILMKWNLYVYFIVSEVGVVVLVVGFIGWYESWAFFVSLNISVLKRI